MGTLEKHLLQMQIKIKADLKKNILMIEKQEDVVLPPMLEEENTNEDVEPHAQINGGDILNLFYNLLFHSSFQVERMGGVFFCHFFCYNTFINFTP